MNKYSKWQLLGLTSIRIMIGWHLLYEGLVKLCNPAWTSKDFLLQSTGPFSSVFQFLGTNPNYLNIVDMLNIIGLVVIGLSLFVGLFNRITLIPGILLLLMYYFAYPPFIGLPVPAQVEGHSLIINNHLIEAVALFILILYPTSHKTGVAGLFKSRVFR